MLKENWREIWRDLSQNERPEEEPEPNNVVPTYESSFLDGKERGSKVLVAADSGIALRLRLSLERAGYHVIVTDDVGHVIGLSRSRLPDIIVMDLHVPYCQGFEVLELLRRAKETRRIPVIPLSGFIQDTRLSWEDERTTPVIHKPFRPDDLVRLVAQILRGEYSFSNDSIR